MELDSSISANGDRKRGGWITFPFIIATSGSLMVANTGWVSNLIVYLIEKFNVKSIDAAQVFNIVNGCTSLSPLLGAIIADSFLGCFSVISISSFITFLGTVLLTLTTTIPSLRPQPCENPSTMCPTIPSKTQFTVLYAGLALACMGVGCMRFTLTTMGANQFPNAANRAVFFNWYFFSLYAAGIVGSTAIVYVEDNVSWAWGFGLCAAANAVGLAIFLFGSRFYHHVRPEGSPFTGLARVVVASIRKRKLSVAMEGEAYFYGGDGFAKMAAATPTKSFR